MASIEHRVKNLERVRRISYGEPLIITTKDMPVTCFRGGDMELHRKPGESETLFLNRAKAWAMQHRLLVLDGTASLDELEEADHADA